MLNKFKDMSETNPGHFREQTRLSSVILRHIRWLSFNFPEKSTDAYTYAPALSTVFPRGGGGTPVGETTMYSAGALSIYVCFMLPGNSKRNREYESQSEL